MVDIFAVETRVRVFAVCQVVPRAVLQVVSLEFLVGVIFLKLESLLLPLLVHTVIPEIDLPHLLLIFLFAQLLVLKAVRLLA